MNERHGGEADEDGLARFIKAAFRSIWSLELMLLVRSRPEHGWTRAELIAGMRASEQVLARSVSDLLAAGLVSSDHQTVRYAAETAELDDTCAAVARLYARRPGKVRRLIVSGTEDQLARFADAFRFRGTQDD